MKKLSRGDIRLSPLVEIGLDVLTVLFVIMVVGGFGYGLIFTAAKVYHWLFGA